MRIATARRVRFAIATALALGTSVVITAAMPASGAELGADDFQISAVQPQPTGSRVAYNATDDEFLAVWRISDPALGPAIYGQRLDATDGSKLGGEFLITQFGVDATTGHREPAVVWNSTDNEYAVVSSGDQISTGTAYEIYAQRVGATGSLIGGLVRVSDMGASDTDTGLDATEPDIAYNPTNNNYLVVWEGDDDTAPLVGGEDEIHGQLLSSTLAEIGTDVRLSDMGADGDTGADGRSPAVAFVPGGNYLVVWEGDDNGVKWEIHGQLVDPAGAEVGSDFVISTEPVNDEAYDPDVAADPGRNRFMVVWEHERGAANDFEVDGALVTTAGAVSNFTVSNTGDASWVVREPAVAYNAAADLFSVVWTGDHSTLTTADEHEVIHVLLDPTDGSVAEAARRISTMGPDGVASSAVTDADTASGPNGTFVAVWTAENPPTPPAGESEVFGQLLGQEADLGVTKTLVTPADPGPGDTVTYTIAYTNTGPGDATSVDVTDTVPAGLDFLSAVPAPSVAGDDLTWTFPSVLSGGGGSITLTLVVDATATDGQVIVNSASISSTGSTSDPNAANDSGNAAAVTVDFPPSVAIDQAAGQADPTNTSPITFDVVFSEAVTGFTATDITLGGTAGATTALVTPLTASTYTATVSGMTGDGTVTASIAAGVATDTGPSTKPNTASTSTDNEVTYDTTAPTVTIEQGAAQADPTNTSPITFDVVFSEAVTGFTATDITLGGTAGATTALVTPLTASTYTATVSGMTGDGTVTASIAAGVAADAAGNTTAASTSTDNEVTYDTTAPTVTIEQGAAQADPTNTSPITFDVVFSEAVTGFTATDITLGGTAGATTALVTPLTASTYTATVSGMTGDGTVTASIAAGVAADAAGNTNAASTSTDNEVTYDATAPTPVIASTETDPTNSDPFDVSIDFGEVVIGFVLGDITVGNGTVTGLTDDGGGAFTATIDPTIDGTVTVDVAAAVAADTAGSDNNAATQFSIDVDTTPPTSQTVQAAGQADPTNAASMNFTVTFSEDVIGFDETDVVLGGTAPGILAATVSGGPQVFDVEVTGYTGDGTVTAFASDGAATDAAGNTSLAMPTLDFEVTVDQTAPTVTIEQATAQADPTNTSPIVFDVVFSEDVTGFDDTDVTIGSTAPGVLTVVVTPVSATDYTVEVTGTTGDGTITASIGAAAAADAAVNDSAASTSADNQVTYDATSPTVTVEQGAAQTDSANAEPIVFDVVFSEPVTGFDDTDVTLSGTAGATTAAVAGAGDTYAVSVTGMTGSGTVVVDVVAAAAADAAGNDSAASTSVDNVVTYIAGDPTPGVNDPPVVTAPAAAAAELADPRAFTGADAVSVIDPNAVDNDIVVTLTADDGETEITVPATTGVTIAGDGTDAVTLTGSQADINSALAGLEVTANNTGDTTITVSADDQGNTDGAALTDATDIVITATDTTAPTITVPAGGVTASNDPGRSGAIVEFDVTVDDPGSEPLPQLIELQAAPTLTCNPASGSFFSLGDTAVNCTATDASGNTSVASFVVTVTDIEDPRISGAVDQTITLAAAGDPVNYVAPSATDNSGGVTVTCNPASGSTSWTGARTVTCTAADTAGNTAAATFTVTANVTRIPDTGGTLTLLPWAFGLLLVGLSLLGAVAANRRFGTAR